MISLLHSTLFGAPPILASMIANAASMTRDMDWLK